MSLCYITMTNTLELFAIGLFDRTIVLKHDFSCMIVQSLT